MLTLHSRFWPGLRSSLCSLGLGAFLLLSPLASAAEPVVVIGDSWGVLVSPLLEAELAAQGFGSNTVANHAVGGSRASQWVAGVFDIAGILAANPDVEVVHISLGGNDLIAAGNVLAIQDIARDVAGVAAQVAALTDAGILISGYDYVPNPPVPEANLAIDLLMSFLFLEVSAEPTLFERAVVVNTNGLMQVHFGVGGLPPFDPGLPDSSLPGPAAAFADSIHLNAQGYAILAGEWFDRAYGCADGIDGDGDGLIDLADPGCSSGLDLFETNPLVACDDAIDNDGDGLADFLDPGCSDASSDLEDPQCQDGINNDGALGTDFDGGVSVLGVGNGDPNGPDPHCVTAFRNRETPPTSCGLGAELAVVMAALGAWRGRGRRRRG